MGCLKMAMKLLFCKKQTIYGISKFFLASQEQRPSSMLNMKPVWAGHVARMGTVQVQAGF